MSYLKQKTWQAVDSLVTAQPIQKRLVYALQHLLVLKAHIWHPDEREFSTRVEEIVQQLSAKRRDDGNVGWIDVDDDHGAKIAGEILSLYVAANGGL